MNADGAHLRPVSEQLGSEPSDADVPSPPDSREEAPATTWKPIDLAPVLDGDQLEQPPAMLARTDGAMLMYVGKSHAVSAESEAGKTMLAEHVATEQIAQGHNVLYVDFEDGPETAVSRLLAMGAKAEAIAERFHYVRPDEPLSERAWGEMGPALEGIALAVIDGVTEALTMHGLDLENNRDVARWLELLPRPLQRSGAAVLQLDHVTKDREQRGRYAIGAQHKLAGIDVAYSMKVLEPFGRGVSGSVRIEIQKDRPGHLRALAEGKALATMEVDSLPGGALDIALEPPDPEGEAFRPTVLMERVSRALEKTPGLTKNGIEATVKGKAAMVRLAVELLIGEGYVDVEREGQACHHYSKRPFDRTDGGSE